MKSKVLVILILNLVIPIFIQAQTDTLQIAKDIFQNMVGKWELDFEASEFAAKKYFKGYNMECTPLEVGIGVKQIEKLVLDTNGKEMSRSATTTLAFNKKDKKLIGMVIFEEELAFSPTGEIIDKNSFKLYSEMDDVEITSITGDVMTKETLQLDAKGNIIKGDRDLSVFKRKK
jgi:hypothetical protein